jgi:hypothetical protein
MSDVKGGGGFGGFGGFGLDRENLLLILFLSWLFKPGCDKGGCNDGGGIGYGNGGDFNQLLVILLFLVLSGGCF